MWGIALREGLTQLRGHEGPVRSIQAEMGRLSKNSEAKKERGGLVGKVKIRGPMSLGSSLGLSGLHCDWSLTEEWLLGWNWELIRGLTDRMWTLDIRGKRERVQDEAQDGSFWKICPIGT